MNEARHDETKHAPFDTTRLDTLLENEGIDVLVATSKHNVQYLLGGYRFFFFDYMDAIGVSVKEGSSAESAAESFDLRAMIAPSVEPFLIAPSVLHA